ncbi:hypothetical protein GCM10017687_81200 [Streptomyces echinatus]
MNASRPIRPSVSALGGARGQADDVRPAVPVDRFEEQGAELGLQDGTGVVEGAPDGDVGVGRDGREEPGDERAVADVLAEHSVAVGLGQLGVAGGVGEQRAGAVVVHQAGVDHQDADRGGRVVTPLGGARVGGTGARDGHRLVAGAGVDRDVQHVVAPRQPASPAALGLPYGAQGVRHRVLALRRVADPDPGHAGAAGLRAHTAHMVGDEPRGLGEVAAHGVLDEPGLLAVPDEHDTLLVEVSRGVVRSHGQRDVRQRALDVVELLVESLWRHACPPPGDGVRQ